MRTCCAGRPSTSPPAADGFYAGSFFDRRGDDGLPEIVYGWWRDSDNEAATTSDNAFGGRVLQTDDGTVLWFAQGRNSAPVYKIHGWNNWQRESGTLTITDTSAHAQTTSAMQKARLSMMRDAEALYIPVSPSLAPGAEQVAYNGTTLLGVMLMSQRCRSGEVLNRMPTRI